MKESSPIRVLIAEDQDVIREGFVALLMRRQMHVVAEARNGEEAFMLYRQHHPDVVLMDWNMPRQNGPDGARAILREFPDAAIILMSAEDHRSESLQLGARAFLMKDSPRQHLLETILQVHLQQAAMRSGQGKRESCNHFHIFAEAVPMPGMIHPLRVAYAACGLCEQTREPQHPHDARLFYGPDGNLVSRESCTPRRFQEDCSPRFPDPQERERMAQEIAAKRAQAQARMQAAKEQASWLRERAQQIQEQWKQQTARCQQLLEQAQQLRQQTATVFAH